MRGKGQMYKKYFDVGGDRKNPKKITQKKSFLHESIQENEISACLRTVSEKRCIETTDFIFMLICMPRPSILAIFENHRTKRKNFSIVL